jgi:hypothetical protein
MGFIQTFVSQLASFAESTPWSFASSAGVSGGAVFIGASGGKLYVANSETDKPNPGSSEAKKPAELWFAAAGGSAGAPFSGSYSTPDMWSKGSNIRQRGGQGKLTFSDMQGPIVLLVGASILVPGVPAGLGASIVFLGAPYSAILQLYSSMGTSAVDVIMQSRAVGVMVGEFRGVDASIGVLTGYAH